MKRSFIPSIAAVTLALALALSPLAPAGAQPIPDDMPAPELLKLAPQNTQGIVAVDMSRIPRDQLPEAKSSPGPVQPGDVKKVVAFVSFPPQMLGSVMGPGTPKVPFSVIMTHSGDPDAVETYLSEQGSSAGSELGSSIYKIRQKKQDYFAATADEGTLIGASSKEQLSQLLQSYKDGEGPGMPNEMASTLRPGKDAALVAAVVIPKQVSDMITMIKQNNFVPEPVKGLNRLCISFGFPGEKLAARIVGIFQDAGQAQKASQMVSGQLAMLKQAGAGKMMPRGQEGGEVLASLLDTVNVSASGPELTVSAEPRFSDIRGAVEKRIGGAMKPTDGGLTPMTDAGDGNSSGGGQDEQSPQEEDTASSQDSSGAPDAAGEAEVRETNGVELRVSLEKGDWFGEQRTLVRTELSNQSNAEQSVSYGYEVVGSDGNVLEPGGGAVTLEPSGSSSSSIVAKKADIQEVRITYLDTRSEETDETD